MSNYNNRGGAERQHKDKICYAELTGIVRPLSLKEGDPVRFFPFKNGGGAIHFFVEVKKDMPADASGQPRVKTERFKVDAFTNKSLTPEFLQSIVPGMKVNVACEPTYNFPKDQNGQPAKPELVFRAFAVRITEYAQQAAPQAQPMQQQYPPYQPQGQQYAPQQGYAPQQQYAPQQGYAPQQYAQPSQQPYAPAQYPNQAYGQPGGQYVPQGGFAQPQGQAPTPPAYYQTPPQPMPGTPTGDMPAFDDLPEA